jgi:hypothetical protein
MSTNPHENLVHSDPSSAAASSPAAAEVQTVAIGPWSLAALALLVVAMSVVLSLAATRYINSAQRASMATVDLVSIVEDQQLLMTERLVSAKSSGQAGDMAERERQTLADLEQFSRAIDGAVVALQHDCRCVLLTKAAVIGSASVDLTGDLRTRLGMPAVNGEEIRARMKKALSVPSTLDATVATTGGQAGDPAVFLRGNAKPR